MTTPVIRCIKQQTGAEVHYLIKPSFAHVIHENPYIDKIHRVSENLDDTIELLKSELYDLVVDLQKNLKSIGISKALGIDSVTFTKLNIKKWLAVNFKINTLPKGKHLVDRYFESLGALVIKDDGLGFDFVAATLNKCIKFQSALKSLGRRQLRSQDTLLYFQV